MPCLLDRFLLRMLRVRWAARFGLRSRFDTGVIRRGTLAILAFLLVGRRRLSALQLQGSLFLQALLVPEFREGDALGRVSPGAELFNGASDL